MSDSPISLMFLAGKHFDSGKTVRGAFLLTDAATKPLEFRCTNPIRPTQLQTMLYGEILEEYILVELIGQPLVKSAKEVPSLVLVKEAKFLQLRTKIDIPVVLITKEERINTAGESAGVFQLLNSVSGKFDPVVISVNPEFPDDKELARHLLSEVFNRHDLAEPFARVITALEQVHIQKVGEGQTA